MVLNTTAENAAKGEAHGGYGMTYTPTRMERLRRALGFRFHYGEEPEGIDDLPGWMCTVVNMKFGAMDRLRLLATGRLHLRIIQHTPVQCDFSRSRVDWQIKTPGES